MEKALTFPSLCYSAPKIFCLSNSKIFNYLLVSAFSCSICIYKLWLILYVNFWWTSQFTSMALQILLLKVYGLIWSIRTKTNFMRRNLLWFEVQSFHTVKSIWSDLKYKKSAHFCTSFGSYLIFCRAMRTYQITVLEKHSHEVKNTKWIIPKVSLSSHKILFFVN